MKSVGTKKDNCVCDVTVMNRQELASPYLFRLHLVSGSRAGISGDENL